MKTRIRMLAALAAAPCLLAGCHDGGGHHTVFSPVTFLERERNDDPATANHFGVLLPGDTFVIEGHVTDDGSDPFDGFAFTAGMPLHADFQLFIDGYPADLDVCLYDPETGDVVECWATSANPEQGGVDVTGGGLDFHLVVESFFGASTYGLEVYVEHLYPAARVAGAGAVSGVREAPNRDGARPAAESDYARVEPRLMLEITTELDPQAGILIETVRTRPLPPANRP